MRRANSVLVCVVRQSWQNMISVRAVASVVIWHGGTLCRMPPLLTTDNLFIIISLNVNDTLH